MVPDAVSMSTRDRQPASTMRRQISSPWIPGEVAVEHDHVVVGVEGAVQA